jgi:hypothetical protein
MFVINGSVTSAADLLQRVEQIRRDSLKPVQNAEGAAPDFAQRLKLATQQQLAGAHLQSRIEANVAASNESFGKKIADAVKARLAPRAMTQKQHDERAARERARYPKPPRKRSKSE